MSASTNSVVLVDLTPALSAAENHSHGDERYLLRRITNGETARSVVGGVPLKDTNDGDVSGLFDGAAQRKLVVAEKEANRFTGEIVWPEELYEYVDADTADSDAIAMSGILGIAPLPDLVLRVPKNVRQLTGSYVHGLLEPYFKEILKSVADINDLNALWKQQVEGVTTVRKKVRVSIHENNQWKIDIAAGFDAGIVRAVARILKAKANIKNKAA